MAICYARTALKLSFLICACAPAEGNNTYECDAYGGCKSSQRMRAKEHVRETYVKLHPTVVIVKFVLEIFT